MKVKELSQVNELLYGTGEPQEKVEEAGSSSKRLSNLLWKGRSLMMALVDCFQLEDTIMNPL